jgi:hypothetical protein
MIEAWGESLEQKDPGTWGHCKRVAAFATILAQASGLDDEEIRVVADAALLHEIGRLAIPEAILRKPAKLTREEMLVMRETSSRGYEMLRDVPSLAGAAEIVYATRERFDGTGYPAVSRERRSLWEPVSLRSRIRLRCSSVIGLTTWSTHSRRRGGKFNVGQEVILIPRLSKCS